MGKTEFTASATVRLTVEVSNLGPYGEDWPASKIHAQTAREAISGSGWGPVTGTGDNPDEWPAQLRLRQFPESAARVGR